jgi:hypothetical protein
LCAGNRSRALFKKYDDQSQDSQAYLQEGEV